MKAQNVYNIWIMLSTADNASTASPLPAPHGTTASTYRKLPSHCQNCRHLQLTASPLPAHCQLLQNCQHTASCSRTASTASTLPAPPELPALPAHCQPLQNCQRCNCTAPMLRRQVPGGAMAVTALLWARHSWQAVNTWHEWHAWHTWHARRAWHSNHAWHPRHTYNIVRPM